MLICTIWYANPECCLETARWLCSDRVFYMIQEASMAHAAVPHSSTLSVKAGKRKKQTKALRKTVATARPDVLHSVYGEEVTHS